MTADEQTEIGCVLAVIVFTLLIIAGWFTHVVYTIQHHQWVLLIAGAIAAPVGVFHGWGLWFGFWR